MVVTCGSGEETLDLLLLLYFHTQLILLSFGFHQLAIGHNTAPWLLDRRIQERTKIKSDGEDTLALSSQLNLFYKTDVS